MTRSPDDAEDIAYEMDRELGNAEQREINRRVEWARRQRETPREESGNAS